MLQIHSLPCPKKDASVVAKSEGTGGISNRLKTSPRALMLVPSCLSLGNLSCGALSICASAQGDNLTAISLIGVAVIFDGLDGPLARLWNCTSELGGFLDSQADLISFGLAPVFVIYFAFFTALGPAAFMLLAPYTLAAAVRLAIFNKKMATPANQNNKSFNGMPAIVASGLLLAPLVVVKMHHSTINATFFMPLIALSCGALMVSSVPFPRPPITLLYSKYPLIAFSLVAIGILTYVLDPWLTSLISLTFYILWAAMTWVVQILKWARRPRFEIYDNANGL